MERKYVFQLPFLSIERVKAINQVQFDALCSNYSCFEKIYAIIWSFKTLLATKDASLLDAWMISAKDLGIREIDSFVEGLSKDISVNVFSQLYISCVNHHKVFRSRVMYLAQFFCCFVHFFLCLVGYAASGRFSLAERQESLFRYICRDAILNAIVYTGN